MNSETVLIGIAIGLTIGVFVWIVLRKQQSSSLQGTGHEFAKIAQEALRSTQEQFLTLASEKLKHDAALAKGDLEHKKDTIEQMIQEMRKDLLASKELLKQSDDARIASFSAVAKELEMHKGAVTDLKSTTDDLKRILSNNQLRGAFGEQVAENLLKMAGFVTGVDYVFNKAQDLQDSRPDFTVMLPDGTKINIDAKFPYSALVKMSEVEDRTEKEQYRKQFASDVKQKVKQVTGRGYINPEERTVDFVILFIPNEMIFSFIYDQLNDVWEEAMRQKVILAGPFSFTAILRMVKQAHSNFRYQENLHQVIGLIQKFEAEYEKYSTAVDTLGDRIQSAAKQFEVVSATRTRALTRVIDQIKSQKALSAADDDVTTDTD
ncbi:MAG: DNA recombination protein RmuC [Patescibacteria group bacterium]